MGACGERAGEHVIVVGIAHDARQLGLLDELDGGDDNFGIGCTYTAASLQLRPGFVISFDNRFFEQLDYDPNAT